MNDPKLKAQAKPIFRLSMAPFSDLTNFWILRTEGLFPSDSSKSGENCSLKVRFYSTSFASVSVDQKSHRRSAHAKVLVVCVPAEM